DTSGRSVKLAVEPQDKSGRKSPLGAGTAGAECVEILKCSGLADAKDDSVAGIGRLAGIHPATRSAPIQVAVRALHQSAVRRAAIGIRRRNAAPGENMQRCQLTRRCQLKDCARTGMNRITRSGNAAALAVVATGHSSPIEVAVRSLEKRALRRG